MKKLEVGDTFGEMAVFSNNSHWPATVVALDNCTIFFLEKQKIISQCNNVCECHNELITNMLMLISNRALLLNKKVEYLSVKGIRAKLSKFLIEQYKKNNKASSFMLPMNRNELADFLNVSRPSMSREMCHMRDEGIIEFYKETVKVLNYEKLSSSYSIGNIKSL